LTIQCNLIHDLPDWVLEYLRGLATDPALVTVPELPEDHAWLGQYGELPDREWFRGPSAMIRLHDHQHRAWVFGLQGSFHQAARGWIYTFLKLLARWSEDSCIACSWTDRGESGVEVWYAGGGELFNGAGGQRPLAVNDERTPLPLPGHLYRRPDGRELRVYGLDDERAETLAETGNDNPALARWLLARRLWRAAVEEGDYELLGPDASARQVAAVAVEHVLRALDEGRDPEALQAAPGWRLVETTARPSRPWPLPIASVADHLGDLKPDAVGAGPIRLNPGMRIRTVKDLPLTASSSGRTTGPSGASSHHSLKVLVPAGTTLTVAEVWEKGHASATAPEWTRWITEDQLGSRADENRKLRSDSKTYSLGFIHPLDAGDHWIVAGPPGG
jgi:hypothetical protein